MTKAWERYNKEQERETETETERETERMTRADSDIITHQNINNMTGTIIHSLSAKLYADRSAARHLNNNKKMKCTDTTAITVFMSPKEADVPNFVDGRD